VTQRTVPCDQDRRTKGKEILVGCGKNRPFARTGFLRLRKQLMSTRSSVEEGRFQRAVNR